MLSGQQGESISRPPAAGWQAQYRASEQVISSASFNKGLTQEAMAEMPTALSDKVNVAKNIDAKQNIQGFMYALKVLENADAKGDKSSEAQIKQLKSDFFSLLRKDKLDDKSGLGNDHSHKNHKRFEELKNRFESLQKDGPYRLGNWLLNNRIEPMIELFAQQNPQVTVHIRDSIEHINHQRLINAENASTSRDPFVNLLNDLSLVSKVLDVVGCAAKENNASSVTGAHSADTNTESHQFPAVDRYPTSGGVDSKSRPSEGNPIKGPVEAGTSTASDVSSSGGDLPFFINNHFSPNISIDGLQLRESQGTEKLANPSSTVSPDSASQATIADLLQAVRNLQNTVNQLKSQNLSSEVIEPTQKSQQGSFGSLSAVVADSVDTVDNHMGDENEKINSPSVFANTDSTKEQNSGNDVHKPVHRYKADEGYGVNVDPRSQTPAKLESQEPEFKWPKVSPTTTFVGSVGSAQSLDTFNHRRGSFDEGLGKLADSSVLQNTTAQVGEARATYQSQLEPKESGVARPDNAGTFADKLAFFRQLGDGTNANQLKPKLAQQSASFNSGNGNVGDASIVGSEAALGGLTQKMSVFRQKSVDGDATTLQSKLMQRSLTSTPREPINTHVRNNTDGSGSFADKLSVFRQQSLDSDVTKLQSKSMHRPLTVTPESNNSHVTDNTDGSGSFGDKLAAFRQQSLDADTSKLQPKPLQRPARAPEGNATLSAGSFSALSGVNVPRTRTGQ
ncbi:hypothetical protein WN53_18310 [Serratia fonticola]|uniref:hypothetical protein n=1 Tax=Serratia fonticola TaxID=47917 RepID=UPI00046447D5|nr:hypothetical protein [Serratia fonticola]AKG70919.1 hypothetical protein WN53_18310 [Serratia fonticola]